MSKAQYLAVGIALALFAGLYWGFGTTPPANKKTESAPMQAVENTGFEQLLSAAKTTLNAGQTAELATDEQALANSGPESEKITHLKALSARWYELGNLPVSAGYAEQVAELEKADTAWSVAGALFFNGLLASQDPSIRDYCGTQAAKSFETAATLNPKQVEHRVNLALVYAENPPPDNPMKAVMMLRDLEKQHPENPAVYNALGRLAIKTGQWERAVERLEKAWALDNQNPNTPCLLARAYEGAGQMDKAAEFAKKCK